MNVQKLPSGHWRARVYVDGKYKSFTAATKREAERRAALYTGTTATGLTVAEAVKDYISAKREVLSPSTVLGYESLARNAYETIGHRCIDTLTAPELQRWVGAYAKDHSPKRVRNANALLVSALKMFRPDFRPDLTMPARIRNEVATPSTGEVAQLLDYLRGRDRDLYVATLLGAYGPMRRGEICALTGRDVDHRAGTVTVRRNKVIGPDGAVIKGPKTEAGYRTISLPAAIMEELPLVGSEEYLITTPPERLSARFKAAAKACGLEIHFHSLRHFGASVLHAWGVPDQYIMQRGGWESDHVMKRVYRTSLDDQTKRIESMVAEKIKTAMSQHDTKNT